MTRRIPTSPVLEADPHENPRTMRHFSEPGADWQSEGAVIMRWAGRSVVVGPPSNVKESRCRPALDPPSVG